MDKRVGIITGAASGIGKRLARTLVSTDSWNLVLVDINYEELHQSFAESASVRLHKLDIQTKDGWKQIIGDTLAQFGRLDALLNIAGWGKPGFLADIELEMVDTIIHTNLCGTLYGMKLAAEVMAGQGAGHIVNMASLAGMGPTPGNALYCAAKSGLRAASLAAAMELRERGVYVTVICPDLVDTAVMERHLRNHDEDVALIFSGPRRVLTVSDLERAILKALKDKPLEISLPRWRGWLVKLNSLYPPLMLRLYGPLKRKGLKRMAELRKEREITLCRRNDGQ